MPARRAGQRKASRRPGSGLGGVQGAPSEEAEEGQAGLGGLTGMEGKVASGLGDQ